MIMIKGREIIKLIISLCIENSGDWFGENKYLFYYVHPKVLASTRPNQKLASIVIDGVGSACIYHSKE